MNRLGIYLKNGRSIYFHVVFTNERSFVKVIKKCLAPFKKDARHA
jgi:hypothetical protein